MRVRYSAKVVLPKSDYDWTRTKPSVAPRPQNDTSLCFAIARDRLSPREGVGVRSRFGTYTRVLSGEASFRRRYGPAVLPYVPPSPLFFDRTLAADDALRQELVSARSRRLSGRALCKKQREIPCGRV